MDLKNINFTDFIRYILTGLNFVLFIILLPAFYFEPELIKDTVSDTSALTILLFSIAIGYLMDMLKAYQFTPNFRKNTAKFHEKVAGLLDVPVEQAGSYFSITSKLWDENSSYNLERHRAEWVLILHTAIIFFVSSFVWIFLCGIHYFTDGFSVSLYIPSFVIVANFLLSIRLYRVGRREITKDDQEFFLIMSTNKKKIKDAWKLIKKK